MRRKAVKSEPGESIVGIGVQFGDEGKIKEFNEIIKEIVKYLRGKGKSLVCARYNGGSNAGHGFFIEDKHLVTHAIPSGFADPSTILYIGSGCVLNPVKINHEIAEIESFGFDIRNRLFISPKASLVQPYHPLLDSISGKGIGTTQNGIGQAYADQAARAFGSRLKNIPLGEYVKNPRGMRRHVKANLEEFMDSHGDSLPKKIKTSFSLSESMDLFHTNTMLLGQCLAPRMGFLRDLVQDGNDVFFEGANSAMLDCVTGYPPNVTSSRTVAAAAYTGGDLSVRYHRKTIGVAKAIMSRVGSGPFVSEFGGARSEAHCKAGNGKKYRREVELRLFDPEQLLKSSDLYDIGIALRILFGEYGATTMRPRRMGMLDLVMLRDTCAANDVDELYLNRVDSLYVLSRSSLPGIPLVTAYELDGKRLDHMPSTNYDLSRATPVIEYFPHISRDISGARSLKDLPREVKGLIGRIEGSIESRIFGIGVGPGEGAFVKIR